MTTDLITSPANPLVKRMKRLRLRKYREKDQAFLVEGITHVWRALEHSADLEIIVVAPELLTSGAAYEMLEQHRAKGARIAQVSRELFEETTEREHPSGLAAIVRMRHCPLGALQVQRDSLFVALEEVGNPGNLGSILRTVDATQGAGVILLGHATDPYHPVSVKASMGTLFTVPLTRCPSLDELFAWTRQNALTVVTTSARAEHLYWRVDYSLPTLFLFGSEARGLAEETIARGDLAVHIPMEGAATSLNLAVSVGVLLYEVKRQLSGSTR